jgi:hypothetical protein
LFGGPQLVELSPDYCMRNIYSKKEEGFQYKIIWNKLFKRKLLVNHYFKKLPAQDVAQDVEYNLQIYLRMRKAILSPVCLYLYNQRPMSLTRQNVSYRSVNAMRTFFYCLNEIPEDQKLFRAYSLNHLYFNMIIRVFNSKGTPFHQDAKVIAKDIRKQTIVGFLKNPYIPIMEKIALTTFNYFPFFFTFYSKIVGTWNHMKKLCKCI